jgi:type II secretory pathway component GspD/PulD (secretin)
MMRAKSSVLLAAASGALLCFACAASMKAQSAPAAQAPALAGADAARPRESDRRRAAKLYLAANKQFMAEQFEDALKSYTEAAQLDPGNNNYRLAGQVARNHAVTALIQAAAKSRLRGDEDGARAALTRALTIDPTSVEATQHLYELGGDSAQQQHAQLNTQPGPEFGEAATLSASEDRRSFHVRSNQRQILEQVFRAYGIEAMMDDSVRSSMSRLDLDDANFDSAANAVSLLTKTFYVPIDAHRVVVASDTQAKRQEFMRQVMETVYLPGLKDEDVTAISTLAKGEVFGIRQADINHATGALVLRGPKNAIEAFNATIRSLVDGRNQVVLDVRLIQVAHVRNRHLGVQPPQSFAAYNVFAEEQSILSQNADLVQQIISQGLAAPGDTLAILGILIASGQVKSAVFSNGLALFGGGITQSALSPGPATANFNFDSSDSRELDDMQLRLGDGEQGTLKLGQRYPIQTSSFSSLSGSVPNIPGLNSAGNSGSLSSILASLQGSVPSVPQVQYQDLGMTLKTTANVMRNDHVALTLDLQISALAGSVINGNPVLNNRAYSGIVTIKEGTAVVVVSDLDRSESRAISGTPGFSEIPGMNNVTDKNTQRNFASLLIVITPHIVRFTQTGGHTPMLRIQRASQTP